MSGKGESSERTGMRAQVASEPTGGTAECSATALIEGQSCGTKTHCKPSRVTASRRA